VGCLVEVTFQFTRDDCVEVHRESYRLWLHRLVPLSAEERVGYLFCLIVSVLAVVALLGTVAAGIILDFDWYIFLIAAVVLPFPCLMILAVLRVSAGGTKRGLYHELIFRWNLQDDLLASVSRRYDRDLSKQEKAGMLDLGHRYLVRLDAEHVALITDYPLREGPATTQEDRYPWNAVTAIDRTETMLYFRLAGGGILSVPRRAFAGMEEEDFVRTAEERRTACRQHVMVPTA
jgi:YcxB-like protein